VSADLGAIRSNSSRGTAVPRVEREDMDRIRDIPKVESEKCIVS